MLVMAALCVHASADDGSRGADPQGLQDLVARGAAFLQAGDARRARQLFARADNRAAGHSADALFGLARAELALERFDSAVEATERLLELDVDDDVRAPALLLRAVALLSREVNRPSKLPSRVDPTAAEICAQDVPEDLRSAERALRSALEISHGRLNGARYYLTEVLMRQRRDGEALELLREYFEQGVDPGAQQAAEDLLAWLECVKTHNPTRPGPHNSITYPETVEKIQPTYPPAAVAARVQGNVVLATVVDDKGDVACVIPWLRAPVALTDSAIEAIRKWRYTPGSLDGEPVSVYFLVVVEFIIKG